MGLEQRLKTASQNISHQLGSLRWSANDDVHRRHQMVAFSSTFVSNLNDVSENMTAASQDFLVMHNCVVMHNFDMFPPLGSISNSIVATALLVIASDQGCDY